MFSVKKNTIFNYVGRFYAALIGVIILPLYLSYLNAEAFGLIGFFIVLSGWLALLEAGLASLMTRESARLRSSKLDLIELKKVLRTVEFLFLIFSVFVFVFALFNNNWIANNWLNFCTLY